MEYKFYFILPILAVLICRYRQKRWAVASVLVVGAIALDLIFPPKFQFGLLPYLCIFCSGSLAAFLYTDFEEIFQSRIIRRFLDVLSSISASAFSIFLVPTFLSLATGRELPNNLLHQHFLISIPFAACVALSGVA